MSGTPGKDVTHLAIGSGSLDIQQQQPDVIVDRFGCIQVTRCVYARYVQTRNGGYWYKKREATGIEVLE